MPNIVEIRDLRVEARTDSGRTVEIIKGVSFDVPDGEIVALIGESGSGKTTIALTLMGHTRPGCSIAGGSVRVGTHDMARLSEPERAKIRNSKRDLAGDVTERVAALIAVGLGVRQLTAADAVEHDQNDTWKRSQVRDVSMVAMACLNAM